MGRTGALPDVASRSTAGCVSSSNPDLRTASTKSPPHAHSSSPATPPRSLVAAAAALLHSRVSARRSPLGNSTLNVSPFFPPTRLSAQISQPTITKLTGEKFGSSHLSTVAFLNGGFVCAKLGFGNVSGGAMGGCVALSDEGPCLIGGCDAPATPMGGGIQGTPGGGDAPVGMGVGGGMPAGPPLGPGGEKLGGGVMPG